MKVELDLRTMDDSELAAVMRFLVCFIDSNVIADCLDGACFGDYDREKLDEWAESYLAKRAKENESGADKRKEGE